MEVDEKIELLSRWIASIAGQDDQYGLVEDWLLRGKFNRAAIAKKLGVDSGAFEQTCHLDEPTRAFDEFADMLRQKRHYQGRCQY